MSLLQVSLPGTSRGTLLSPTPHAQGLAICQWHPCCLSAKNAGAADAEKTSYRSQHLRGDFSCRISPRGSPTVGLTGSRGGCHPLHVWHTSCLPPPNPNATPGFCPLMPSAHPLQKITRTICQESGCLPKPGATGLTQRALLQSQGLPL